jgi:hypothetical protein
MTGELFDGFLCEVELFRLRTEVEIAHKARRNADETLR